MKHSHTVHESYLGRAPPRVRLGVAGFQGGEAGAARQGHVTDVWWAGKQNFGLQEHFRSGLCPLIDWTDLKAGTPS